MTHDRVSHSHTNRYAAAAVAARPAAQRTAVRRIVQSESNSVEIARTDTSIQEVIADTILHTHAQSHFTMSAHGTARE